MSDKTRQRNFRLPVDVFDELQRRGGAGREVNKIVVAALRQFLKLPDPVLSSPKKKEKTM